MKETQPESYAQQEAELPIDIDYAKFLDWLIDRRCVPRNWHTLLKAARTLTRTAVAQTPQEVQAALKIPALSAHENLPYHTALNVFHGLIADDAPESWGSKEKDLLGRYKSPLHRAWADAVSAFEKKYVYLADAAQLLVRNADVEAAAIKSSISKFNADIAESVRREGPTIRAAAEAKERFEDACREFSLEDDDTGDFEIQLRKQIDKRVPEVLTCAVEGAKTKSFVEAVTYYDQFSDYVSGEGWSGTVCAVLKDVVKEEVSSLIRTPEPADTGAGGGIDWGTMLSVGEQSTEMDDPGSSANAPVEIDWGIEIGDSGTAVEVKEMSGGGGEGSSVDPDGGIDWGVETATPDGIEWNESPGNTDAKETKEVDGGSAETIEKSRRTTLADPSTREQYLNDLIELDAFLEQRRAQLSKSSGSEVGLVMQQAASTPEFVKRIDAERVKLMQDAVQAALVAINSDKTRQVLALQSNPKRLERVARSVLEKKHAAERMHGAIDVLRQRRTKAASELAVEGPKLEQLGEVTRDVKRKTEESLSSLYRGRSVNILGEINNTFPPH